MLGRRRRIRRRRPEPAGSEGAPLEPAGGEGAPPLRAAATPTKRAAPTPLDAVLAPVEAAVAALQSPHPRAGVGYSTIPGAGPKRRRTGGGAKPAPAMPAAGGLASTTAASPAAAATGASQQPVPLPAVRTSSGWRALDVGRSEVRSYAASSSALADLGDLRTSASCGYGLSAGTRQGGVAADARRRLAARPGPETLTVLAAQSSSYSICASEWGRLAVADCLRAKYGSLWALARDLQQSQHQQPSPQQLQQQPQLHATFLEELHYTIQHLQPVFDRLTAPQRHLRRSSACTGPAHAGAGLP